MSGGPADNIAGEHSLGGNILSIENLHQQGDCCNAHKFYAVVHSGNLRGAANGEEGGRQEYVKQYMRILGASGRY